MFTCIVRTHNRPDQFARCIQSLVRTGEPVQVVVTRDCSKDVYVEAVLEASDLPHEIVEVRAEAWPPNNYFNLVHDAVSGQWIHFIDDDDMLVASDFYDVWRKRIADHPEVAMFIWRANLGRLYTKDRDTIIPEPRFWGKPPVLSHFSTLNMGVRSDSARNVQWKPKRGGDGYFAKDFWDRYGAGGSQVCFIPRIMTATQAGLSTHRTAGQTDVRSVEDEALS